MRKVLGLVLTVSLPFAATAHASESASLRGSPAAMVKQNRVAKAHGLAFYRTTGDIRRAVESGDLMELRGNEDYSVADFVNHPYLHPAVVLFVERLASQYREACDQKLVVTSGTRPANGQPSNSHALSVHPAGMAVDLRVSDRAACRSWIESALLDLESRGVLNGIREFRPPHYHVAVFPEPYTAYAEERIALEEAAAREQAEAQRAAWMTELASSVVLHPAGPGSALAPAAAAVETDDDDRRQQLTTALALILALPFGIGYFFRKTRRRER